MIVTVLNAVIGLSPICGWREPMAKNMSASKQSDCTSESLVAGGCLRMDRSFLSSDVKGALHKVGGAFGSYSCVVFASSFMVICLLFVRVTGGVLTVTWTENGL
ncbi:JM41 [macacine gammaherpesvirus 11]|uniref:JM41 n=2 Tax=macacine gammaherpesvirus 11 TaxID=2560570 RepID=G9JML9_9GAMA|nr:JM41 [Macaca fuscata rhadinovirus]AAT00018.1 JM41 [Macaca fuscata rhadinovirus]AEW87566.1 JM41 [Macaca fuscata rhadinovirus]AEW87736.1 JM41 [Macaca fuscata rhadinovirus]